MNLAEKILVVPDQDISYNLNIGGAGGFGYINSTPELIAKRDKREHKIAGRIAANKNGAQEKSLESLKRLRDDSEWVKWNNQRISESKRENNNWIGRNHSDKTKQKMREANRQQGQNNSQFGTCWITDGKENKKILKDDLDEWINKGYKKGRNLMEIVRINSLIDKIVWDGDGGSKLV